MLLPGLGRNKTRNEKIFPSFSTNLSLVQLEIKLEWRFFNFLKIFHYFFGNAPNQVRRNSIYNEIFFISFSSCPAPVWHEIKAEIFF